VHALIATGTPMVVVPLSGRPHALGSIVGEQGGEGAAAVVQAFFPGQQRGRRQPDREATSRTHDVT
jgi:hypothetical protein